MSNSDECTAQDQSAQVAAASRTRNRAVRRVFIITLVLNAAVALTKAIYGLRVNSLSVGTDSLHSVLDASANVLALLGLHWSSAPADARHPYGHRKIEILAALGIGVLIVIGMFELASAAVRALLGHTEPPRIGLGGFAVVLSTMVVNAFVSRYEHRKAHELGSALLHADAKHTQSDLYASAAVVASFLAVRAGFGWADAVAALVLVALVSRVAWDVFKENVPILIDTAMLDPGGVIDVARAVEGVEGVHRVRSRGVRHAVELDLHLQVGAELSLREAHALSRQIETQLRVKFPVLSDVVIHVEPSPPGGDNDDDNANKTKRSESDGKNAGKG
jgi:cation diffusion facilitator family transporter